jgi:predicted ester cyclase
MHRDEMKRLADEMVEVTLNQKDVEASGNYWKDDMIWHGPGGLGVLHGIEDFKHKLLYPFFRAFPDYIAHNVLWAVDEQEQLVTAWGYFTGTHQDVWAGAEATGRPVQGGFMDIWRIEDGKLAENWVLVDVVGVLQQVGVLEVPEHLPDARVTS